MEELKDSGIQWIGDIHGDWRMNRLKYVSDLYTGNSISDDVKDEYEISENAYPYISTKDIDVSDSSINYINGMYTKKSDKSFKIAPAGSTLMCVEGGSAGRKIGKTNQIVSFVNKLCCFNAVYMDSNFLYMYLKSESFKEEFIQNISGLIGGVSINQLKNFTIITPKIEEQQQIADFLDDKVSKIDDILVDLNKQVDILNQYKKSLITETVTKGLNPNVEMKESGIEWIGEIPSGWELSKVKYIAEIVTDGAHITPDTSQGIHRFVSVTDMDEIGELNLDNCLMITNEQYEYFIKTGCKPRLNDVLISKDGTVGKTTVVKTDKDFIIASSLVIIRPIMNLINSNYLNYNLMSDFVQKQLTSLMVGSALKRVSVGKNSNLIIFYTPNMEEQQQIVDYLDNKCSKIDESIKAKKKQIEVIEQYKKSLIYEYVTGKKRVKGDE